jgi:hypothetical protein
MEPQQSQRQTEGKVSGIKETRKRIYKLHVTSLSYARCHSSPDAEQHAQQRLNVPSQDREHFRDLPLSIWTSMSTGMPVRTGGNCLATKRICAVTQVKETTARNIHRTRAFNLLPHSISMLCSGSL